MLRNSASGNYYGRFTLSGKQKWVNMETDVWTVAKLRLADERAKIERLRQTVAHVAAGDATMGALAILYRQRISTTDKSVEGPTVFGLEKHLEDFLVQNWKQTELGKRYGLFEDEMYRAAISH